MSGGYASLRAFCQWEIEHQVRTVLSFSFFSCNHRRRQKGPRGPCPPQISGISCDFLL